MRSLSSRVPALPYDPDGMAIAEFDGFGATRKTMRQFSVPMRELDHLA